MRFAIDTWDGSDEQLIEAAELFAEVFAEPPYNEDRLESVMSFVARVRRYVAEKPDFRLLIATDDLRAVGLVLGTGISQGDWWWDRLKASLPMSAQELWLDMDCFSVAELAVAGTHRRHGVAAALMDAVLQELPYRTALLGCYQDALPAQRLYGELGWAVIDPAVYITDERAIQVMGIRLET